MIFQVRKAILLALLVIPMLGVANLHAEPVRLVVFGDSLSAGYGLPPGEDFVTKLYDKLGETDQNLVINNAGVSGDTSSAGLARIDWSVPDGTDGVLLELGANDMLRGLDPTVTAEAMEGMVKRLQERGIAVLLIGMRAAPNLGPEYVAAFDAIYPDLARRYDLIFYPFFLEGVAAQRHLNQDDTIHPNEAGVAVIVDNIAPTVVEFIDRIRSSQAS